MSLKVLLADDNITAQRMGSKILLDAGYNVVSVSNGAAAVKKIASEKPELIILDVFMPGYTGLEVCEKVKNAAETARTPVLLTITSVEPFRPEDGNRVKADGVLTKPFEATDLLAVVRKMEEKLHPAEPEPITAKMPAVQEFSDQSYTDWKAESGPYEPAAKPPEMPHEIGSAPLLGTEGLAPAPDALSIFAVESSPPPSEAEHEPPSVSIFEMDAPSPAFDLQHGEAPVAEPVSAPPAALEFSSAPQAVPVEVASAAESEPTLAPPAVVPAAEFEPTLQPPADEISVVQEPELATDPSDFMQFATKFGQELPEDIPVGIAMEEPPHEGAIVEAAAEPSTVAETSDIEHEMRQALETPAAAAALAREPEPEVEVGIDTQPLEIFPEPLTPPAEVEAAPAPPAESHELTYKLESQFEAELNAAQGEAPAEAESHHELESPAAAATASAITLDEQHVAEVVERVLERYKDELVAAIIRELHS